MKKNFYKSISETDYLSDEQLNSIEMGGCPQSCKQGCSGSNFDGQQPYMRQAESVEDRELQRVQ
jgi:hypothetical protein